MWRPVFTHAACIVHKMQTREETVSAGERAAYIKWLETWERRGECLFLASYSLEVVRGTSNACYSAGVLAQRYECARGRKLCGVTQHPPHPTGGLGFMMAMFITVTFGRRFRMVTLQKIHMSGDLHHVLTRDHGVDIVHGA